MKFATLAAGLCVPAVLLSVGHVSGANAQVAPGADAQLAPPIIQRIGPEFVANKIIKSRQYDPTVAGLSNGNFVVAWTDESQTPPDRSGLGAVRARIFQPNGVAVSTTDFLVNQRVDLSQNAARVATLKTGGFVAIWADNGSNGGDASGLAVHGRRFNNGGGPTGAQFGVNAVTQWDQYKPTISQIPTGGYIAAWFDDSKASGETGYGIRARVFKEGGGPLGPEFLANTTTTNTQDFPAVAGLSTGESVVVWQDGSFVAPGDPEAGNNVRARLIGTNGRPKGNDFLVNNPTVPGEANTPHVASIGQGRYVVVWEHEGPCCEFDPNIRGQVLSADGKIGGEFTINTTTLNQQLWPRALGLGAGKFVVCWVDISQDGPDFSGNAVRCQAFKMNGVTAVKHGPEFTANTVKTNNQGERFEESLSLGLLKNGDFVVTYTSGLPADANVRGQVFRVN
jgi:hypothetical protein